MQLESQWNAVKAQKHKEYLHFKSINCNYKITNDSISHSNSNINNSKIKDNEGLSECSSIQIKQKSNKRKSKYPPKPTSQNRQEDRSPFRKNIPSGPSVAGERKAHPWPKRTVPITGDSIISGIDKKKFTGPTKAKVRSFPGAKIMDMQDNKY